MIQLTNKKTQSQIIDFIVKNERPSAGSIQKHLEKISRPTFSRYLKELKETNIVIPLGKGRSTKYELSRDGIKAYPFDLLLYDVPYQTSRSIHFNHSLFEKCSSVFTDSEKISITETNTRYTSWNTSTEKEYKDLAFERCAIEFAWKSSKIEGNTYTLLETENLIKNREEVSGKTHDDAVMILNQKNVFDLMYKKSLFTDTSKATLINIHTLLTQDLRIPFGIRKSHVGITGTQYVPLKLQSQIEEALADLFTLLATIENPLERAIVALASIAYVQPFVDGNKRASRHFANLILHSHNLPPVAWRTVNEIEYKKAMIAFYELGNIRPIAEMWVRHYIETVDTFFR